MYGMTDNIEGLPAYYKYLDAATAQHIKKEK